MKETGSSRKINEFFQITREVQVNSIQDSDPKNSSIIYKDEMLPVDL